MDLESCEFYAGEETVYEIVNGCVLRNRSDTGRTYMGAIPADKLKDLFPSLCLLTNMKLLGEEMVIRDPDIKKELLGMELGPNDRIIGSTRLPMPFETGDGKNIDFEYWISPVIERVECY